MIESKAVKPDYGNWVSMRLIYGSGAIGLVLLGLSFLVPILFVGAALFILAFVYFVYARFKFSPQGGDIQSKIQELV